MTFAVRKALAVFVVLGTILNVFWIAQYNDLQSPFYVAGQLRNSPAMVMMTARSLGSGWYAPPWWQTADLFIAAVAVGVLGLALAARVYPRRAAASPESWTRGIRAGSAFHRPLAPYSTD